MEHGFRRTEERYSTCNKGSNGDKDMENRLGIEGVEGDHGPNGRLRYLKVVFSTSSVSVAVDPMMILLRQYIYSQFQQLEQAFLSPLQILNSYTVASLIYQNIADLLSGRQLLPELLLILTGISTVHHITHPPPPFKQTAV